MTTNYRLPSFDTLVALYRKDPVAYDQFRKKLLENEVAAAPLALQPALRYTLKQIELARENAKSPIEAAIIACRLMFESTLQLREEINNLQYLAAGLQASMLIERTRKQAFQFTRH